MATLKILYNNCYGGFDFSEAFLAEYKARTGKTLDTFKALFRQGLNSIRCDPLAIAILEEKGSALCSGSYSVLAIHEIPAIFSNYWEIDDYDGDEHVRILVNDALADILHTFMDTNDRATLDRQYKAITDAAVVLKPLPASPVESDDESGSKSKSGTDYKHYDHGQSYFDTGCP